MTSVNIHQDAENPSAEPLPPHHNEAEQMVLGSMMLSSSVIAEVFELITPASFYSDRHQAIATAIVDLDDDGKPADAVSVSYELERRGEFARAGGGAYLHTLINMVQTAANAAYHAQQVRDAAERRVILELGKSLQLIAHTPGEDTSTLVNTARDRLDQVSTSTATDNGAVSFAEQLQSTWQGLLDIEAGNIDPGLPTGYTDLDDITHGLHPGQMVVIGGRPGAGKSTVGLDIARNACLRQDTDVLFFSLEMSPDELVQRTLSAEARVRLTDMRGGTMEPDDWDRMRQRLGEMQDVRMTIDGSTEPAITEIRSRARRWAREVARPGLIVVDYLQLVPNSTRAERREQEVSNISRQLKLLAKELDLPVVAIAQLNRETEQRTDQKPRLSDLRESGAIEQDADLVILLNRPDAHEADSPRMGEADLILAKHRAGPTSTVTVAHQLHYSRLVDMAPEPRVQMSPEQRASQGMPTA